MMELFIHIGKSELLKRIEIDPQARVGDIVAKHGVKEGALWREDADAPIDDDMTLANAGIGDGERVYAGRCKRVLVKIHFSDQEPKTRKVPPSTTIARLLKWAVGPKGFNLPIAERPKHTLAVCDTDEEADLTAHVGEFTDEKCKACFNLVPKEKFEG